MIRVGIVGGAGYTAGELLRVLVHHPHVRIVFVNSKSQSGKKVSHIHQDLLGTDIFFTEKATDDVDVVFICSGHGTAPQYLKDVQLPLHVKIIDLGSDFRLKERAADFGRTFVYGLPELQKEKITEAHHIANPGCFATAIQLSLLPLAQIGELGEVFTTGITGSTGAGHSLSPTTHFSWRANNIQAYKTLTHQHISEVHQSLHQLQGNARPMVHFVPWRGDFTRGIFVSSQVKSNRNWDDLHNIYSEFYAHHPFTHISTEPIHLKQVVNTNNAVIQLEKNGENLVIHCAIDNLLKGASGQAVQNMNLMFGLKETEGLRLKANLF